MLDIKLFDSLVKMTKEARLFVEPGSQIPAIAI
jgi:hypothetical protein